MSDLKYQKFNKTIVYSFLIIGAVLLFFSNGTTFFALATWLFSIPLLFLSRGEKKIYAFLVIPLIFAIVSQFSFWKFTYDNPTNILFYIPFFAGIYYGLVFFIDAHFYHRIKGFTATLIFPLTYTSFEFLLSLFNPFGTAGLLGYTQLDFLPFSQLASITGMWGLTFMITWFGSVVHWLYFHRLDRKSFTSGGLIYFVLLAAILVYGMVRINMPIPVGTVKIAGIHTHDKVVEGVQMNLALSRNDTVFFKELSNSITDSIIKVTREQARNNAKIIVWSEISTMNLDRDEDSLVKIFKAVAQEENIYLMTNPFSVGTNGAVSENKILFFAPNGETVLTHMKYGGNFMEGTLEGDKNIKTINTPYGKIAALICWDADFPSIVKQVGNSNADILLIPASNWKEIAPLHTMVAVFRGIENGCSVLRQTRNGLSIISDPRGKVISKLDHFSSKSWVITGEIPNKKMWTLYPLIGDLFGWLSMIGLGTLIFWCFYKSK